jgi:hypothetical protein
MICVVFYLTATVTALIFFSGNHLRWFRYVSGTGGRVIFSLCGLKSETAQVIQNVRSLIVNC